jgi:hypothetical protein
MPGESGCACGVGEWFMHNSGASRREIADSHLRLFWLFEN